MPSQLANHDIIAFVGIQDVDRARVFYRDKLGLTLVSEELPFALVFNARGIMLRLAIMQEPPQSRGTVLGWSVPDIDAAVTDLQQAGITFERYEFMPQNERGIWVTPTGASVAWFKDPDGNTLSISQHPEWKK